MGVLDALLEGRPPSPEPQPETLRESEPRGLVGEHVEEGAIGTSAALARRVYKRGGDRENRGRFSHVQGSGGGRVSSKPGASAVRTPQLHKPASISRPRTALRPTAPRAAPDEPSHHKPKLSEKQLAEAVGTGSWSPAAERAATKLLRGDGPPDTEHAHRQNLGGTLGHYTRERIDLHNRIVGLLFQGAGFHPEGADAVFMAGGPASGKSKLVKSGKVKAPKDAVDINPDIIKEMLPEYRRLKAAGDKEASSKVHEESSHIAKLAMNLALARKHHVLVDGVGNSGPGKFARKLTAAANAGHRTRVVYATIDTDIAVTRAEERGKRDLRYVPVGYIRSAHQAVSARFIEDISAIPGVGVEVYRTDARPTLIARVPTGSTRVQVVEQKGYDDFIRKARTHAAAA